MNTVGVNGRQTSRMLNVYDDIFHNAIIRLLEGGIDTAQLEPFERFSRILRDCRTNLEDGKLCDLSDLRAALCDALQVAGVSYEAAEHEVRAASRSDIRRPVPLSGIGERASACVKSTADFRFGEREVVDLDRACDDQTQGTDALAAGALLV